MSAEAKPGTESPRRRLSMPTRSTAVALLLVFLAAGKDELKPFPEVGKERSEQKPPEKGAPPPPPTRPAPDDPKQGPAKRERPKPKPAQDDPCKCDLFLREALKACEASGECTPDLRTRIYEAHGQCQAGCAS